MKNNTLFFFAFVISSHNLINSMNNSSDNINQADSENTDKTFLDAHKCPYNRLARVASQEKNEELGRTSGYYGEHIEVLRVFRTLHPTKSQTNQ